MRSERGFTLVEVMVALVIVAMALPALLYQMGTMASTTLHAREVMLAHWVAENKLQEIYLTRQMQKVVPRGRQADDVDMAGERWDWAVQTEETAIPGMLRMRISVKKQGQEHWLAELSGFTLEQ